VEGRPNLPAEVGSRAPRTPKPQAEKASKPSQAAASAEPKRKLGRPRASSGPATRQAILDAAEKLFLDLGYHGTSLDAIAAASGLTRTALYYYFPSKVQVARAVLIETGPEQDWRWWSAITIQGDTLAERLRYILTVGAQRAMKGPHRSAVYFALIDASETDQELHDIFNWYVADIKTVVTDLVNSAIASGELPPNTKPKKIIEGVLGLIWCIAAGVANAPNARVESQIRAGIDLVLATQIGV
jgi:AcrR family transcriptional regulator